MSKFPDALLLPEEIPLARKDRIRQIIRSSTVGILIRFSIIVLELIGFSFFQSHSLLVDALSSLLDIGTTVFLLVCIFFASRPPDENHPFGHGRFEPLAGLQLGLLFIFFGISLTIHQAFNLVQESRGEPISPYAWIIAFIAVVLLEISYRIVKQTAKKIHSTALEADAIHYRIDSITSLVALVALLVAAFTPAYSYYADQLGSILIAIIMIVIGFFAAKNNLNQLMDRIPNKEWFFKVENAAKKVLGVKDTEKIRIQHYGPDAHVDIDIEVEPHLSVEEAHKISQKVRLEIQKSWPSVRDVTVHIEPYYLNDHQKKENE